jgi:hypothetical protein
VRISFALGLVVFIGLSLWVSAPLCGCSSRTGGYAGAMKSDLRNLASQQEIYFSDHETYSADPEALRFFSSPSVTITIFPVSDSGWAARSASLVFERDAGELTGVDCVAFEGKVPELPETSIKKRTPDEDRPVVCDMDGWRLTQSRLERWLWRRSD